MWHYIQYGVMFYGLFFVECVLKTLIENIRNIEIQPNGHSYSQYLILLPVVYFLSNYMHRY